MKILVITSAPVLKNQIFKTLNRGGHKLKFVANGNEVWRLIEKERDIRIVITDLSIPGIDGIELCKKIRNAKFSYYIYIMLMSSKNKKADMIKGIKEGADDLLTEHYPESLDRSFERLIFDVKEFMG
ncbi:MAG: response regulator [Candidatus Aminicenantes bacterium]|jgi:DNA-binding response OmpR family regulator